MLISSIVTIALMISGGCGGGGESAPPSRTGFPPECSGTFDVDLSCPASSLAGSICLPYTCDIIDDSVSPAEVIDAITIVFGTHCTESDCFTLECQDIFNGSVFGTEEASIVIETVNGIPVGEGVEGEADYGLPDGRIIIGNDDLALDCNGAVTP